MADARRGSAALCLALVIAGCGAAQPALAFTRPKPAHQTIEPLPTIEPPFPVGVDWDLSQMNGKPVSGDAPTLRIDPILRATGFSGCNTYSMTLYPARGRRLLAGAIAMTRKICDGATMAREHLFLAGLHSAPTWRLEQGDLILRGPAATLRFRRGL